MEEKKCGRCGKSSSSWKNWFFCRQCGADFCPDCSEQHQGEEQAQMEARQRKLEKMARGDMEKQKRVLCPHCDSVLTQRYSPDL